MVIRRRLHEAIDGTEMVGGKTADFLQGVLFLTDDIYTLPPRPPLK